MLKPLQKNILKNKLKIDQYQTQTYKQLQDHNPLLITKSIVLPKHQTQDQDQKKKLSKKIKFNLDHQGQRCHCSRHQRHKSNDRKSSIKLNKESVFRLKKSFTTTKLFSNTSIVDKEEKNIHTLLNKNANSQQRISQAIITFLKRDGGVLKQSYEANLQIKQQSLKTLIKYLISFKVGTLNCTSEADLLNKQEQFTLQLDQYLKRQVKQEMQTHLNHCSMNFLQFFQGVQGDISYQQDKKNKNAILCDLKRKIEAKSQELQALQQRISLAQTSLQKYESKTFHIDHYLNKQNKAYIEQLFDTYQKHLGDLNACSILVETEEEKNMLKQQHFTQIEENVKEEFIIIHEIFYGNQKLEKEMIFVKDVLRRVMECFRTKYNSLQKKAKQKSAWITQLIGKIKNLAEFSSFKQEYLQKLANQFRLTYIRTQNMLSLLKKKLGNKENAKGKGSFVQKLQQICALQKKMYQNYTLTSTFQ